MFRKPSTLDRYIAGQIVAGAAIVGAILLGIAWFSQIIRLLSYLVNNSLSFWTFIKMTSLLLPDLIVIIMPIAIFSVILFVYNRLIADRELVIMEAAGLPPKRLARPALIVAAAGMIVAYACTMFVAPAGSRAYRNMISSSKNDLSALLIKEGEFNQLTQGVTIYVKSAFNNTMSDIFVNDSRRSGMARTIIAQKGIIRPSKDSAILILENGSIQEKNGDKYTFGTFEHYTADLGLVSQQEERSPNLDEFSALDLLFARERGLAHSDNHYLRIMVELHRRLLSPLMNVLFALIALAAIFSSPLISRSASRHSIIAAAVMVGAQIGLISSYDAMAINRYIWPVVYISAIGGIIFLARRLK
ncbi:MAG: LptF/LptG family permease [Rickettsiales bacterium]|jgi:lipopolysaccharide export system permease protein|nr:LptF/LptG family permease [Rickettsiales bacterium]